MHKDLYFPQVFIYFSETCFLTQVPDSVKLQITVILEQTSLVFTQFTHSFTLILSSPLCTFSTHLPHLLLPHRASTTFLFFFFTNAVKGLFHSLLGNSPAERMEMERGPREREHRSGVEVDCGTAQRVSLAKAAQTTVCVCVCVNGPLCQSMQQRTSLPHHRSNIEALLPRPTEGPHSHLSPHGNPLSPLLLYGARVQLSTKGYANI